MLVVSAAGLALGTAIILYDYDASATSERFVSAPETLLWISLIALQMALWAIAGLVLGGSLRSLWRLLQSRQPDRVLTWRQVVQLGLSTLALLALACVVLFPRPSFFGLPSCSEYPLAHHCPKLVLISSIGLLVALLAVVGIWLVDAGLRTIVQASDPDGEGIESFLRLREHLQRFLLIAGTMIGAGTLSTGALRKAILETTAIDFPLTYVLIFGGYFSLLLALVYAPTYAALLTVGRELRDSLVPIHPSPSASWSEWHSNRRALDELLQLQVTVGANFRAGVYILTPLAGSILGLLLGESTG